MKETLTMKFGWKTKMVKELNETWFFQPLLALWFGKRVWRVGDYRESGADSGG